MEIYPAVRWSSPYYFDFYASQIGTHGGSLPPPSAVRRWRRRRYLVLWPLTRHWILPSMEPFHAERLRVRIQWFLWQQPGDDPDMTRTSMLLGRANHHRCRVLIPVRCGGLRSLQSADTPNYITLPSTDWLLASSLKLTGRAETWRFGSKHCQAIRGCDWSNGFTFNLCHRDVTFQTTRGAAAVGVGDCRLWSLLNASQSQLSVTFLPRCGITHRVIGGSSGWIGDHPRARGDRLTRTRHLLTAAWRVINIYYDICISGLNRPRKPDIHHSLLIRSFGDLATYALRRQPLVSKEHKDPADCSQPW